MKTKRTMILWSMWTGYRIKVVMEKHQLAYHMILVCDSERLTITASKI
jgi:hypothetical protein